MKTYCLLTGATGGLGQCFAEELAQRGNNVLLVGRNEEKLDALSKQLHALYLIDARYLVVDLADSHAAKTIEDYVASKKLPIKMLINNAGFGDSGAFVSSKLERQLEMLDVNIRALTELTHRIYPYILQDEPAYILNVASIAAFMPGPYMSVYFASKAYVKSFTAALSAELKDTAIQVSCLCPGPVATGFEAAAKLEQSDMFKLLKPSCAKDIVRAGLAGTEQGKHLIVAPRYYGLLKFCALIPHKVLASATARLTKAKHS